MTLDATKRPGFLTRVGFLSTFSHYDTSRARSCAARSSPAGCSASTGHARPEVPGDDAARGQLQDQARAIEALTANPALQQLPRARRSTRRASCSSGTTPSAPGRTPIRWAAPINSTADVYFSATGQEDHLARRRADDRDREPPNAQRTLRARSGSPSRRTGRPNANDACIVDTAQHQPGASPPTPSPA